MIQTPGGLRPQSTVTTVLDGQVITREGDTAPVLQERESPRAVNENGWITYSAWNAPQGRNITNFVTNWRVPAAPAKQSGQLLYLFNGIMNSEQTTILQPVLQWGVSDAGGGEYWGVASWYVDIKGQTYHTNLVPVQPGQFLSGVMTLTGTTGSNFNYTSEFVGIPGTQLAIQNIELLQNSSETLEAYYVDDCAEYPTGDTAFTNIEFTFAGGAATPAWDLITPYSDCGQHATIANDSPTDGAVDLFYGN
jgi:hypothetical protein